MGAIGIKREELLVFNKKLRLINQKSIWKLHTVSIYLLKYIVCEFESGFTLFLSISKRNERELIFTVLNDIRKNRKKHFNLVPIILEAKKTEVIEASKKGYDDITYTFFKPNIFNKKKLDFEDHLRALKFHIAGEYKINQETGYYEKSYYGESHRTRMKHDSSVSKGKYNRLSIEENFSELKKLEDPNKSDYILSSEKESGKGNDTVNFDNVTFMGDPEKFVSTDKNILVHNNFIKDASLLTFDNTKRISNRKNLSNKLVKQSADLEQNKELKDTLQVFRKKASEIRLSREPSNLRLDRARSTPVNSKRTIGSLKKNLPKTMTREV